MSTLTGSLLKRNRNLLGVVRAPSTLISQAINPQRSQLQPSAQSLSERYDAGSGTEDLEEQNTESIADAVPTMASDTSITPRQPSESKPNVYIRRQAPSSINHKEANNTDNANSSGNSRQLSPYAAPLGAEENDQKDFNICLSAKDVELHQRPSQGDQVAPELRPTETSVKVPPLAKTDSNSAAVTREPGSQSETVNNGQHDRPYIAQLRKIKALHEADYAAQDSRLNKVEADTAANTNSGIHTSPIKVHQKPLLPNRNPESLASPQRAKRLYTRVNIGAINIEVIEPKSGSTDAPAGTRRQAKRSSKRSYQGQSSVKKIFGFGQM